jgi:anti-sigma B factor antagonist
MKVEISLRSIGNVSIISAVGQVDVDNYVELHDVIIREITTGNSKIILDLRKLNFIDSTCLGMLLRARDKARSKGGLIVIISNPFVERVFTVTGLSDLFETFDQQEQALGRLKNLVSSES